MINLSINKQHAQNNNVSPPKRIAAGSSTTYTTTSPHHTLSQIKIHDTPQAHHKARDHKAQALTVGQDIYFGAGRFRPDTREGQKLLAHEMTHAVQHSQPKPLDAANDVNAAEAEAEKASSSLLSGQPTSIGTAISPNMPLRQPEKEAPKPAKAPSAQPKASEKPPGFTLSTPGLEYPKWQPLFTQSDKSYDLNSFKTDSAALEPDHSATLKQIADELNTRPLAFGDYVSIVGHTDQPGAKEHNKDLGQRRADAARAQLIGLLKDPGVQNEIRAYSLGEDMANKPVEKGAFRQVTVRISRRQINPARLSTPSTALSITSTTSGAQKPKLTPNILDVQTLLRPSPLRPKTPDWLLGSIPEIKKSELTLQQFSEAITGAMGRERLAREISPLATKLAKLLGKDSKRSEIERSLNDAMVSGGEAAVKALLEKILETVVGSPSARPENPYGSAMPNGLPSPTMFNSPVFTF